MLPYGYENNAIMCFHQALSLERHRLLFYLNEQTDFFQRQKKYYTLHQSKLYKLFRNQNLDYTTTDLFSLADVRLTFVIFLLR
jgi:hypothetical protein